MKKMGRKRKQTNDQKMEPILTENSKGKVSFAEKLSRLDWRDIERGDFNKEIRLDLSDRLFSWEKVVKDGDNAIIPAFHFQHPYAPLMEDFCQHLGKLVFSLRWSTHKMKDTGEPVGVFWPVIVHEIKGLYLRVQFFGDSDEDLDELYWVNLLSEELKPFDGDLKALLFVAPPHIKKTMGLVKLEDQVAYLERNMEGLELMQTPQSFLKKRKKMLCGNKYREGERVELLDNLNSDRVRVAVVQQVRGRRANFKVLSEYYDVDADSRKNDEDRQYETDHTWIDESSPLIFHVGWAALADYTLEVSDKADYRDHARRVAQHIDQKKSLNYFADDATLSKTMSDCRSDPKYEDFQVGMKLEFLDWLDADMLNCLKVGTIIKILPNNYLLIESDEGKRDDVLPVHASSAYIFPPDYAYKHEIPLFDPQAKKAVKNFNWSDYLERTKSKPAPSSLFHETPEIRKLEEIFPIGSHLEASCHNESHLYFPSKVKAIHGRLIEVQYLGYSEEYTELFDYKSSDLFPVGHSEGFGLTLLAPQDK
ncbi:unnamed protein product, partial [Mesorhabditis belari]|uniref:Uncharacterized protein n=1 Tax=Mesorhabditis belari TaxID=2138241 RepID=A0AAF3ET71_9BILA